MRIEKFENIIDFVSAVNDAIKSKSDDLTVKNIKKLMNKNKDLIVKHRQNPALGQCIHALAERVSDLSSKENPLVQNLEELAENKILDPELITIIFRKMTEEPKDIKSLKRVAAVSKDYHAIADRVKIERINDYRLSLNDVGIKDREGAITFVKKYGPQLLCLDLTDFQDDLTDQDLQEVVNECPNLEHMVLKHLEVNSEALECLQQCKGLKTLEFQNCRNLETLPSLDSLVKLESLSIEYCPALTQLPSLDQLENLRTLVLRMNKSITRLPSFDHLIGLQYLVIAALENLEEIPSRDRLINLQRFVLY